jgi:polysaccharide export outer membrane protein
MRTFRSTPSLLILLILSAASGRALSAQSASLSKPELKVPSDYVIGPDDVLGVVFWREPEMSGDTTVRPDGKITVPVIGEIQAAGLEPAKLQQQILATSKKYLTDASVSVAVRAINSRKVFVTCQVKEPGAFPLTGQLTVLQAIALAGGLLEYADAKNVSIVRTEGATPIRLKFNYKDVAKGKKLEQNILLKPGDTVVVP